MVLSHAIKALQTRPAHQRPARTVAARRQSADCRRRFRAGDVFTGIAGPLDQPSEPHRYDAKKTVVFTAGGFGLSPVYPVAREHSQKIRNYVTTTSFHMETTGI
jgi:hypothetical protein